MREILFRGQHRRKGEKVRLDGTPVESKWVYGGYCQYNKDRGIIYQSEPEINKYSVYADTVGQYTGLTDKNGTKIFEGDIVEYNDGFDYFKAVIKYKLGLFGMACFDNFTSFGEMEWYSGQSYDIKIIGNIFDNPELVENE